MKGVAALNVYQKIAVIRRPTDGLSYEDADGNRKTITDLGKAVVTSTPLVTNKPKNDIPVPKIVNVETYDTDVPSTFQATESFVRYRRPTHDDWKSTLEYVADLEDETWLDQHERFGNQADANSHQPKLALNLLERMMDLLEKETAFDAVVSQDRAEQMILASIPQLNQLFPRTSTTVVTVQQVIRDVYQYWIQKRSKLKRPLLRRFWPPTSADDTNPHLVFRPREKEKYKLRKKRQNDMDAYRKLKQLRADFDNLQGVMSLVQQREELFRSQVQLQCELFDQMLYDITDTSGWPRVSSLLEKEQLNQLQDVPMFFDLSATTKRGKKRRGSGGNLDRSTSPVPRGRRDAKPGDKDGSSGTPAVVAGQNNGDPAPLFVHPLQSRESYVTSWEGAVPTVTSYVNSHATPTFRFRHRPRVGRGGRICIDRLPHPPHPDITPVTVFTAGKRLPHSLKPKERLLDLLPEPLDHAALSRRIEEICVTAISEDLGLPSAAAAAAPTSAATDADENDGEEVLVKVDDWLETDDQLWGEERFVFGPL